MLSFLHILTNDSLLSTACYSGTLLFLVNNIYNKKKKKVKQIMAKGFVCQVPVTRWALAVL